MPVVRAVSVLVAAVAAAVLSPASPGHAGDICVGAEVIVLGGGTPVGPACAPYPMVTLCEFPSGGFRPWAEVHAVVCVPFV